MAILKSLRWSAPQAETLILWISLLAGLALSSLSYEERYGGLVPSVGIFRDRPGAFYALVLSLVFAGSASAGAIIHRVSFPGYARLCRRGGVASLASAAAALTWAAWGACWWWGASLCAAWVAVFAVARDREGNRCRSPRDLWEGRYLDAGVGVTCCFLLVLFVWWLSPV